MYAPLMRREVHLLCFDSRRRLLLLPGRRSGTGGVLTLPAVRRRECETYEQAALRLLSNHSARRGDVVAHAEIPLSPGGGRRQVRVYAAHALAPDGNREACWIPWRDAVRQLEPLAIPEFAAFVEGYVEGWIPDGWITLGS
ncbi:hypothetical protein [Streptomyces sp. NPDC088757]|uniref:hypothetical protein n=1 Tax=Streptomyces sp. NPDC088757 TaxID=3365889 RepID=UPI0038250518